MRILLIMPDGHINKLHIGPIEFSFREAPLTLTTLAALVPPYLADDIRIVDMSVGTDIPWNEKWDVVGISIMTGTCTRGYEIADRFRNLGTHVVLGGIHTTLRPEEAGRHADTLCIGFCEHTWPQFLNDFHMNTPKRKYQGSAELPKDLPLPRRDLQKTRGYMIPNTVMATRGCLGNCGFCSVPAAGYGFHKRPVSEVIDEIRKIEGKRFAISDVHLTQDIPYVKELLTALIPLNKAWGALASTRVSEDPELLQLLRDAGCQYLLLGFESFNNQAMNGMAKGYTDTARYADVVAEIHQNRIVVQGCFIFGFDDDDLHVFDDTIDMINDIGIDIPRFALLTPYPETALYRRLRKERRLLHENWNYYDTQHVVFRPAGMSPEQLDAEFKRTWKKTFRIAPSFRRSLNSGTRMPVTFTGNLAYRLYIRRLFADTDRFPDECSTPAGKGAA